MSKNHHKINAPGADERALEARIRAFLDGAKLPAAIEDGGEPVELKPGEFALEMRGGRLWLEAWHDTRTLARRILSIEQSRPGLLQCSVHRFGSSPGRLSLMDLDRPASTNRLSTARRDHFRELFRGILSRQLPRYTIESLSSGLDLQRSFSSLFPRAVLRYGRQMIAAIACPAPERESDLLTAALLWLDHVRDRMMPDERVSLALFLPDGSGCLTAQRLHWLTGCALETHIFRFNEHGSAGEVDRQDLGNLTTRIVPPGAWAAPPVIRTPEMDLERAVRANLEILDATLMAHPVHAQVLAFSGLNRHAVDLLAISQTGRLAVLELKVKEDQHLPLQALDYWMQIRWHALNGDLQPLFAAMRIQPLAPRLLLIAPAQEFHSTHVAILKYFSPEIEVERIGVNSGWKRRLTVVMRLPNAAIPRSHRNESHVDSRTVQHSECTYLSQPEIGEGGQ